MRVACAALSVVSPFKRGDTCIPEHAQRLTAWAFRILGTPTLPPIAMQTEPLRAALVRRRAGSHFTRLAVEGAGTEPRNPGADRLPGAATSGQRFREAANV